MTAGTYRALPSGLLIPVETYGKMGSMKTLNSHTSKSVADRSGQATVTWIAAGAFFLLAVVLGVALGSGLLLLAPWVVGALLCGLALWQSPWAWRFIESMQPKTEQGRRTQRNTSLILAGLAAAILIITLLYR